MEPVTTPIPESLKALTDEIALIDGGVEQSPELVEKVNALLLEVLSRIQELNPQTSIDIAQNSQVPENTQFEEMLSRVEQPIYLNGKEDEIVIDNNQAEISFFLDKTHTPSELRIVLAWSDTDPKPPTGSSLSFQISDKGLVIMERIAEIEDDGTGGGYSVINLSEQDRYYIESVLRKTRNGQAILRFALAPQGSEVSVFGIFQKDLDSSARSLKDLRTKGGEKKISLENGGIISYFGHENGQLGVGIEYPFHSELENWSVEVQVGEGENSLTEVTKLKKHENSLIGSVNFPGNKLDKLPPFSEITFRNV